MKTNAEKFAELFLNDGTIFETATGASFAEEMEAAGVQPEYSRRVEGAYEAGYEDDHGFGDPVRWVFQDGSVVVSAGDGWDFEGETPFSWSS